MGWEGGGYAGAPQERTPALAPPRPSLTNGRPEVHGDLIGGQRPLPDDELVESSVLVTPGLVLLRAYHQVDVGLPVGVRHFPTGVRGAQCPIDVDFQALLGFPCKQDMSPVGTWKEQRSPF